MFMHGHILSDMLTLVYMCLTCMAFLHVLYNPGYAHPEQKPMQELSI